MFSNLNKIFDNSFKKEEHKNNHNTNTEDNYMTCINNDDSFDTFIKNYRNKNIIDLDKNEIERITENIDDDLILTRFNNNNKDINYNRDNINVNNNYNRDNNNNKDINYNRDNINVNNNRDRIIDNKDINNNRDRIIDNNNYNRDRIIDNKDINNYNNNYNNTTNINNKDINNNINNKEKDLFSVKKTTNSFSLDSIDIDNILNNRLLEEDKLNIKKIAEYLLEDIKEEEQLIKELRAFEDRLDL